MMSSSLRYYLQLKIVLYILHQSDPDVLDLDTDYDIPLTDDDDSPSKNVDHKNIGKHWRDIVNGEQMEGGLTRLEVTNKTPGYTDMDDPNYQPT